MAADAPETVHWLSRRLIRRAREDHASILISQGVDTLTISRRLGHGSPTITLSIYGHLLPNTDDRAARVMDAALAGD